MWCCGIIAVNEEYAEHRAGCLTGHIVLYYQLAAVKSKILGFHNCFRIRIRHKIKRRLDSRKKRLSVCRLVETIPNRTATTITNRRSKAKSRNGTAPGCVCKSNRIIQAIHIHVVPKYALPVGHVDIGIYKPADLRVVVAGLEVVQPCLGIVHISPIPEWILCSQGACERAGAGKQSAPTVVRVFYYRVVVAVNEADDVVLPVADIVVIRTVVVHGDHIAVCIVAEQQRIRARHLRDQHRAVVAVLRRRAVDHLLGSQPVLIIGIGGRGRAVRRARQPPPLPCHRVAAVGGGVAARVVADRFPIVARQLICPSLVFRFISIGDRSSRLAQRPAVGNIGVLLFGEQVPPVVIGVDDRFVQYAVILSCELVQRIVLVIDVGGILLNVRNIPVVVIGIEERRILIVLVQIQQIAAEGLIQLVPMVIQHRCVRPIYYPGQSADRIIAIGDRHTVCQRRRGRAVVLVIGIRRCPCRTVRRAGEFSEVVVAVVLVLVRCEYRTGAVLRYALHAPARVVVLIEDGKAERNILRRVQVARAVVHIFVHARAIVLDLNRPVEAVIHIRDGQAIGICGLCEQAGGIVIGIGGKGSERGGGGTGFCADCPSKAVIRQAIDHRAVHIDLGEPVVCIGILHARIAGGDRADAVQTVVPVGCGIALCVRDLRDNALGRILYFSRRVSKLSCLTCARKSSKDYCPHSH